VRYGIKILRTGSTIRKTFDWATATERHPAIAQTQPNSELPNNKIGETDLQPIG
jgi:hypothetical protein